MKIIPLLRVLNMKAAIAFYTKILDFSLKDPAAAEDDWGVDLINDQVTLMLTIAEGDQKLGIAIYVEVDEVDELFKKYLSRGLDTSSKKESRFIKARSTKPGAQENFM